MKNKNNFLSKFFKGQGVKRNLLPVFIGVCITFLGSNFGFGERGAINSTIQRFENIVYDSRMRFSIRNKIEGIDLDERVVIIDIDEKSLRKEGHWPWSREKVGKIARNAVKAGAVAVGFDIVFPEFEENPADILINSLHKMEVQDLLLLNKIEKLKPFFNGDQKMAQLLAGLPIVLGHILINNERTPSGTLSTPDTMIDKKLANVLSLPDYSSYIGNNKTLDESIKISGFFSVIPDEDGVVRRTPMFIRLNETQLYYSLSLNLFRYYVGQGKGVVDVHFAPNTKVNSKDGDKLMWPSFSLEGYQEVVLDDEGQVLIPYYGKGGRINNEGKGRSYHYISATDILHNTFDKKLLKDTVVIIGTTAEGLYDLRSTPVDQVYPGVEIHANILSALMDSTLDHNNNIFPLSTNSIDGADILLVLITGLLCAIIFPFLRPLSLVITVFLLMMGYSSCNLYLWEENRYVLSLALPLFLIFFIGMLNMAWGYLFETRSKKVLADSFGQYVPPKLVEKMAKNPGEDFGFDGESREMTVLFADIRNFTTISEGLEAGDLKKLLNYFFTPMTKIIFDNTGTIDKYVGDMIMSFWGAPVRDENHRQNAIIAALEMLKKVDEMQAEIKHRNWPEVRIGIGLNTGYMNVGDMGSEYRKAYTVIGDAVNLGSRLEGLSKQYGVALVISETTHQIGAEGIICRPLGRVKVKGKDVAVAIYEPVCTEKEADQTLLEEIKTLNKAFRYYYRKDWVYARGIFSQLHQEFPDRFLYEIYLERISEFEVQDLPKKWDGAYSHTSK